jgi:hypothetical protein
MLILIKCIFSLQYNIDEMNGFARAADLNTGAYQWSGGSKRWHSNPLIVQSMNRTERLIVRN